MSRLPLSMLKMCGHGKSLDEECLACAMMWRIEQRKDVEIARLRRMINMAQEPLPSGMDDFDHVVDEAAQNLITRLRQENEQLRSENQALRGQQIDRMARVMHDAVAPKYGLPLWDQRPDDDEVKLALRRTAEECIEITKNAKFD